MGGSSSRGENDPIEDDGYEIDPSKLSTRRMKPIRGGDQQFIGRVGPWRERPSTIMVDVYGARTLPFVVVRTPGAEGLSGVRVRERTIQRPNALRPDSSRGREGPDADVVEEGLWSRIGRAHTRIAGIAATRTQMVSESTKRPQKPYDLGMFASRLSRAQF